MGYAQYSKDSRCKHECPDIRCRPFHFRVLKIHFFLYNYKQLPSLQGRILSVLIHRQILIFTADRIYGNQE